VIFTRRFNNDLVKLIVGAEEQDFYVTRAHLSRTSSFFQTAFKDKAWKEGKEGIMRLPDDEPDLIHLYLHFLYTGNIACQQDRRAVNNDGDVHEPQDILLARLYCFGEKYQDSELKETALNALAVMLLTRDSMGSYGVLDIDSVNLLYLGTSTSSPVRKLIVEHCVKRQRGAQINDGYCHEFLSDVATAALDELRSREQSGCPRGCPIRGCRDTRSPSPPDISRWPPASRFETDTFGVRTSGFAQWIKIWRRLRKSPCYDNSLRVEESSRL
jgi:hypothetical protein